MKRMLLPLLVLSAISWGITWGVSQFVDIHSPLVIPTLWSVSVWLLGDLFGGMLFRWPRMWSSLPDYLRDNFHELAIWLILIAVAQSYFSLAANAMVIIYYLGPLPFAVAYSTRKKSLIDDHTAKRTRRAGRGLIGS